MDSKARSEKVKHLLPGSLQILFLGELNYSMGSELPKMTILEVLHVDTLVKSPS